MEVVIEDKLPVPLDQLHSCRLSPACNLLTTQEAPRADLLIWSTKQQQKGKEGAEQQEHALLEESLDTPYEFLTTLPSSQRFGLAALPCKARRHGHTQTHKHTNTQTHRHNSFTYSYQRPEYFSRVKLAAPGGKRHGSSGHAATSCC